MPNTIIETRPVTATATDARPPAVVRISLNRYTSEGATSAIPFFGLIRRPHTCPINGRFSPGSHSCKNTTSGEYAANCEIRVVSEPLRQFHVMMRSDDIREGRRSLP